MTENKDNGAVFEDNKYPSKDEYPKELFLSSDAHAVVEHTKKVLVIEDGEVVHLKVHTASSLFHGSTCKLCMFNGTLRITDILTLANISKKMYLFRRLLS